MARLADGVLVGRHVIVPVLALGDVTHVEFPALGGLVEPREQPPALLVLGDVQEELEHDGAVAGEVTLEGADVLEAFLPDVLADEGLGDALARQDLGMHAHHQHLLVVGAVEDADVAAGRQP